MSPVLMWSKWNVPSVELGFFLSALSRAVSSHLCLHETIDYSVSNCFMNIKMKSNIINVETIFRHANHSAAFVSGRLLRFHIPNFHPIPATCWCLLPGMPGDLVLISDYLPNLDKRGSRYYLTCYDKAAYVISQAWLWSDS